MIVICIIVILLPEVDYRAKSTIISDTLLKSIIVDALLYLDVQFQAQLSVVIM